MRVPGEAAVPAAGKPRRIASGRADHVPLVAGDVAKDDHPAIRLVTGLGDELDAVLGHPLERLLEVLHVEEEPDPTRDLLTDYRILVSAVRAGEQQPGHRARRPDDDPALGPPADGGQRG